MIFHHLTYALRRLRKNRTYTFLNVFGLSVGLACFAMIGTWVKKEMSFDKFHEKSDRIYRVADRFTNESTVAENAITSPPVAPALIRDIPEIEKAIRIDPVDNVVAVGDKRFVEDGIVTDQAFFDMFDFKVLHGDRNTLLTEPYSVVISQSLAKRYFGDADPLGKSMLIYRYDPSQNGAEFKVTGVIEDRPDNTHIPYNFILSFNTWEIYNPNLLEDWDNNTVYTYFLLNPNADAASVQSKLPALLAKYKGPKRDGKYGSDYFLQKLTDIHLYSSLSYEMGNNGSISHVILFASIGMIVLLLACINYINLATAYATERLKEVGIHKVMGAVKHQLIVRHLTESFVLAMFSLIVAMGWIEILRPLFERLTDAKLTDFYAPSSIGIMTLIASGVGLASGIYPSLVLSAFKPATILRGNPGGVSNAFVRKSLVVVQFAISIILVIGILGVQLQMNYIDQKDIGFNKKKLVVLGVHGSREVITGYQAFVDDLTSLSTISGVTRSNTTLGRGVGIETAIAEDVNGVMARSTVYRIRLDYDYLDVYEMKLLAGRNFRLDNSSDSTRGFLVNEATTKAFGYTNPADAVGKRFQYSGRDGEIIGVVKDFNFHSLQHKIEPFCAFLLNGGFSRISIRISGDQQKGFEDITRVWKKHFPTSVIQYAFYEDTLANEYRTESRFYGIFLSFSIISLIIACLGLFALVSYTVERRSKEIGIRKVLGATMSNILSMLSREFLLLVALSSLVAIPVGYYFMSEWLTGFAYHVSLNAFMFLLAGALVLVVAWITVSLRTFSAASSNPVRSLRSE